MSKRKIKILLLSPFIFLAINCNTEIPFVKNAEIMNSSNNVSLIGTIRDFNYLNPISEAIVKLNEKNISKSDKNGIYEFKNLKSGNYHLTISRDKYESLAIDLTVSGKIQRDFLLKPLQNTTRDEIEPTTLPYVPIITPSVNENK